MSSRLGPPVLPVNAAGVSPVRQSAEVHDLDAFREIVGVNLVGAYTLARTAAPSLLEHGGAIVNVASVLGMIASPLLAAYGASKAGVIQLTRTLAREWADRGVRVNAVCPAYVETALTARMLAVERIKREIVDATPMGRIGAVDEVVAPVLFLASDAASYITRAVLTVDEGWRPDHPSPAKRDGGTTSNITPS